MFSWSPLLYEVPKEDAQIFWQAAPRSDNLCCVSDVTRMIEAIQQGDPKAADELLPLVYEELRRLAASKMANEAAGNTLQPTALVHEAWLRLVAIRCNPPPWCMKPGCGWWATTTQSSPGALISLRLPPRPCAASSLTGLAANPPCVTAADRRGWIDRKSVV